MLELVNIDESHTDFVLMLNNDEEYSKSFPRNGKISKEQHLSFLKHIEKKGDFYFIIKYNNTEVGVVSIYDIDYINKKAEWGRFIILPEYRTLAVPVARMISKKAFEELGLHKLYAHVLATNQGVVKLNKLLGFKEEGILKDHYFIKGSFVDVHYLSLINNKDNL